MIRTFAFEAKRYGEASTLGESVYDHPFQWGSKRTGPDLAREGQKYPNLWHYRHMIDPREVSPGSIMPPFPTLATDKIDSSRTAAKLRALRAIGVPYEEKDIASAQTDEAAQATEIADNLRRTVPMRTHSRRLVALIAYLQRLGRSPSTHADRRCRVARQVKMIMQPGPFHALSAARAAPRRDVPVHGRMGGLGGQGDDALANRDGGGGAHAAGG